MGESNAYKLNVSVLRPLVEAPLECRRVYRAHGQALPAQREPFATLERIRQTIDEYHFVS